MLRIFLGVLVVAATAVGGYAAEILQPATLVKIERKGQVLPFKTAREAVAALAEGDVLILGPGTHRGPLTIQVNKVTLRGEKGARVTAASADWKPQWIAEPAFGPFAYSSPMPFQPGLISINGRVMINVEEARGGLAVHARGVGRNGRTPLGAIWTWQAKAKRVLISFAETIDPARQLFEAAPVGAAAVKVRDADQCVVENLILNSGEAGVLLHNTRGTIVRNCLIYGADSGVRLYKGATGCKVLNCDITWNADAFNSDIDPSVVTSDPWFAHKQYGTYDKFGIEIDRAGDDNEIAGNYIYDVWNGITNGDGVGKADVAAHYQNKTLKGISEFNRGLKVHHNRVDLTMDDALEPGSDLVNNQWYSNIVTRARCATRFKTVSAGPFWFYDNVLLDSYDGLRLYKTSPEIAKVYIFNNVVRHGAAVVYLNMESVAWDDPTLKKLLAKGTPGFSLYNNLFLCDSPFAAHGESDVPPNYKADCNVYTCAADQRLKALGLDPHSRFSAKPKFVNAEAGDFRLAEGDQMKGCDLAAAGFSGMPELLAQRAGGRTPSVGLLSIEREKTPNGPISGLWELAAEPLGLGERNFAGRRIEPIRWISARKCQFILRNLPAGESLTLLCDRQTYSGRSNYTVTVRNGKGEVLATRKGSSTADREGFTLPLALKGAAELIVDVDDADESQWRVQAGSAQVWMDAGPGLTLRKYDGGRYIFEYPVDASTSFFTVKMHSRYGGSALEIAAPGQEPKAVDKTETVDTKGRAGVYRILVTFTKAAEIKIEGPRTLVQISERQEPTILKQQWGKPKF